MRRSHALQLALGGGGVVYCVTAELVASRHGALTTYSGASALAAAFELAAGLALIVVGLATWRARPRIPAGPLLVVAGLVWFAPDWIGWDGGPAPVRSVAMVVSGTWLVLVVHAVLTYPRRRLASSAARAFVAVSYAWVAIAAIGRAAFRDPFDVVSCWDDCLTNSLLVRSVPRVADAIGWIDLRLSIVLVVPFAALAVRRVQTERGPTRGIVAAAGGAGLLVTGLHAAHAFAVLHAPIEQPRGRGFAIIFVGQCVALLAVALVAGADLVRERGARRAVERLAGELARAPAPGSLEAALARALNDPSLTIAYPRERGDGYLDSEGNPADEPRESPSRAVASIVRDGTLVALLGHDPAVLAHASPRQLGSALRLAVENERLYAHARRLLTDLRESHVRIVELRDAARRQLERDLHDGAQQRLIAISFALRLARAELGPDSDPQIAVQLARAERSLADAITAVRAVANGLFPATLASSGLAFALEELAEFTPLRIDIRTLPAQRLAATVETAAYDVIREAVENASAHACARTVEITATHRNDSFVVSVEDDGIGGADPRDGAGLLDITDRVGALGGRLTVVSPAGRGTRIQAEIPCES